MNKKIIAIFCIVLMCAMASNSFASFIDVDENTMYKDAIERLSESGILQGYPDGRFGKDENLTRAQFAKIVTIMTGNSDVATTKKTETFKDVDSSHWAIGYVNVASEKGLITGYPDGSFAPDENINYAQAVTVIIRMLGYSVDEVGTNWPLDYINKASELGITSGLQFSNTQLVTREIASFMLDSALSAKEGSGNKVTELKKIDDAIIYATGESNSSLANDEILTSQGTFKKGKANAKEYLGHKVTLRVNSDNEIDMIQNINKREGVYILKEASSDKAFTDEGKYIDIDKDTTVYYKGEKAKYSSVSALLTEGCKLHIYSDYIYIEEIKLKGPYTITKDYKQIYEFFDIDKDVLVTIDGEKASVEEIERYDVVYCNDLTNRIYVCTEKVTGIYEKALPSKDNLTEIIVSGTTYGNLGINAKAKLGSHENSYLINDRVTLLFGNDGMIVDVVDESNVTLSDIGVIMKSYSKISDDPDTLGKEEFYSDIFLATGKTVTYKTDKDYSDKDHIQYTGKMVYIENKNDGRVSFDLVSENKISGDFDKSVPSYAGHDFAREYSIIERVYSEKYDEAIIEKINLKDITKKGLNLSQVIHIEYANEMKDIAVLYVENVSNEGYSFGILNSAKKDEESNFTYEIKTSEGSSTYRGSAGWNFEKGEPVMAMVKDGKIKSIKALFKVAYSTKIQAHNQSKIMINDKTYRLGDNVTVVYKKATDKDYNVTTLSDLYDNIEDGSWKIKGMNFYADSEKDGKIRVIKVNL